MRNRACCIFENDEENWKTSLLFLDLSWRERKADEIIRLKELCAHMDRERTCLC